MRHAQRRRRRRPRAHQRAVVVRRGVFDCVQCVCVCTPSHITSSSGQDTRVCESTVPHACNGRSCGCLESVCVSARASQTRNNVRPEIVIFIYYTYRNNHFARCAKTNTRHARVSWHDDGTTTTTCCADWHYCVALLLLVSGCGVAAMLRCCMLELIAAYYTDNSARQSRNTHTQPHRVEWKRVKCA